VSLPRRDHTGRIVVAFASIAALVAPLVWFIWFAHLFPLSEFRDWLVFFEDPSFVRQTVNNLLFRETQYSRDFSLLYVALISNACVSSLVCVNVLAAVPLLFAAFFFFMLARDFTASSVLAAFAVALWSLSTPYLDTMAWQATVLDRVGVCVAMLSILLAWRFPLVRSSTAALSQALVLCALSFASLNAKEAYWFVPILVSIAYAGRWVIEIHGETSARESRLVWIFIVLTPLLIYSLWFAYRYSIAAPFADNWAQHVSSGGVLSNFKAQSKNVFGSELIGGVIVLAILAVCAGVFRNKRNSSLDRFRALWLAILLLLVYLPAARARFPATYYMLPVLAFVLLALAWWASLVLRGARIHMSRRVLLAALAIATTSGLIAAHLRPSALHARARAEQSREFIATHLKPEIVRETLENGKLCFTADPRDPLPVLFVDSPKAYALLRWVAMPNEYARLREIPAFVNYPSAKAQFSTADCVPRFVRYP
jgi:hypothetical protein